MPTAPLRPCLQPGCPALVTSGRCPAHTRAKQRADDALRGSSTERGYDRRWRDASRLWRLDPAHPERLWCAVCGAVATCVDHIEPHRGDMLKFWALENWQSLCGPCHARKTFSGR